MYVYYGIVCDGMELSRWLIVASKSREDSCPSAKRMPAGGSSRRQQINKETKRGGADFRYRIAVIPSHITNSSLGNRLYTGMLDRVILIHRFTDTVGCVVYCHRI